VIISHEHQFIFVKTRKTAGTSVEVFLEGIAGDDAIVTPIWPEVQGHAPKNYMTLDNPVRARALRMRQRHLTGNNRERPAYFNHIAARNIRKRLGRRRWNAYYKFAFERNPWDKVVSEYFWRVGNGHTDGGFHHYVLSADLPSDFDKYSLEGQNVAVDFVGRFESLEYDLRTVLTHLAISADVSLTREKGNYRPPEAHSTALFDAEMSARVERVFAREIRTFGYTCPDHLRSPRIGDSESV
jgi:hypothetical protein